MLFLRLFIPENDSRNSKCPLELRDQKYINRFVKREGDMIETLPSKLATFIFAQFA